MNFGGLASVVPVIEGSVSSRSSVRFRKTYIIRVIVTAILISAQHTSSGPDARVD